MQDANGERSLYEIDYYHFPNAVGLQSYLKVHNSERPCRCANREHLILALAAQNN
jgi:hypothetical protein